MNINGQTMSSPTPAHRARLLPKFTVSNTTRGDYHIGGVARYVHDYAQDHAGKYCAFLCVFALGKWIIQAGFTWNKSPRRFPVDILRN